MTNRQYKTAQGKTIDLGQLILRNETVRAVGNMNVNARGDRLDSANRVIDTKNQQIQRQTQRQTVPAIPERETHTGTVAAKRAKGIAPTPAVVTPAAEVPAPVVAPSPELKVEAPVAAAAPKGGLAGAIAKSRSVVQEKEKTMKELTQFKPGVRKI
jgi:hypothetical protein